MNTLILLATLYVSPLGNDANPGTHDQPFLTIARAYEEATPGTTVIVSPGVYTDSCSGRGLRLGKNGTPASPIALRSEVRGGAVIDGQNGPDRRVGVYIDGSYNTIDGFEIRNWPNDGITLWAGGNQILNCTIHHNGNIPSDSEQGQDGVFSSEGASGNVYTANCIHHNGRAGNRLDHGLYLCGKNEVVNNNIVLANSGNGIQVAGYQTVSNLRVYNNVLAWNGANGILLWLSLNGIDIKNNIFYGNAHWAISSCDAHGSSVNVSHNLSFGNGYGHFNLYDQGSDYACALGKVLYADPLFANGTADAFDAHPLTGSPAVGSGTNLCPSFTNDFAGAVRPTCGEWDLGVYRCATILALRKALGGMSLSWNSVTGKTYRVEYRTAAGAWTALSGVITASDVMTTWMDTNVTALRMYRVRVAP